MYILEPGDRPPLQQVASTGDSVVMATDHNLVLGQTGFEVWILSCRFRTPFSIQTGLKFLGFLEDLKVPS